MSEFVNDYPWNAVIDVVYSREYPIDISIYPLLEHSLSNCGLIIGIKEATNKIRMKFGVSGSNKFSAQNRSENLVSSALRQYNIRWIGDFVINIYRNIDPEESSTESSHLADVIPIKP
ncbi:MAG: hypothetical protein NVSMB46_00110 [Candidatus Saccharimonadales bacterium]